MQSIAEYREIGTKISVLSSYLMHLNEPQKVDLAIRFIVDGAFEHSLESRSLIGQQSIAKLAAEYCEIDYVKVFRPSKIATGNTSETIEKLFLNISAAQKKRRVGELHLREIETRLIKLRDAKNSDQQKSLLTHFWSEMSPIEVKYFLRILDKSKLKIGLETDHIIDAIALAFDVDPNTVRQTHMLTGSMGRTAVMAMENTLNKATFQLYQPIPFMLASTFEKISNHELSHYIVEENLDGMRCQVHVGTEEIKLYSGELNEITPFFPEIVQRFADGVSLPESVLDGVLCVFRNATIQSSDALQKRLGLKSNLDRHQEEHPVIFIALDVLYFDGESFLNHKLVERRRKLEKICSTFDIRMVSQFNVESDSEVMLLRDRALLRGNDGLILKRRDSAYAFGQQNGDWLKVRESGGLLNLVIIYATAPNGVNGGTISEITLGINVANDSQFDQDFVPIGKVSVNETSEAFKRLSAALKPLVREKFGSTLSLEPRIVVEVEFEEIMENKRTKAGYILKIAAIRRICWDKKSQDCDTLEEIRQIVESKANRIRLPQEINPSFR
jgi:DNA ligase-1